ncbi:hypothetical protein VULLAG_LOCUS1804 [Vulpes lagopus]
MSRARPHSPAPGPQGAGPPPGRFTGSDPRLRIQISWADAYNRLCPASLRSPEYCPRHPRANIYRAVMLGRGPDPAVCASGPGPTPRGATWSGVRAPGSPGGPPGCRREGEALQPWDGGRRLREDGGAAL